MSALLQRVDSNQYFDSPNSCTDRQGDVFGNGSGISCNGRGRGLGGGLAAMSPTRNYSALVMNLFSFLCCCLVSLSPITHLSIIEMARGLTHLLV